MAAGSRTHQIVRAGREAGQPAHDHLAVAGDVVKVAVRLLAQRRAQIGGQGDLLIDGFRVRSIRLSGRGNDLRLLVDQLQAIGFRVVAASHQIGQGQIGADQHFFVVFARIAQPLIVPEHGQGRFGQALFVQMVERVPHLPQALLGIARLPRCQLHGRFFQQQHVRVASAALDLFG